MNITQRLICIFKDLSYLWGNGCNNLKFYRLYICSSTRHTVNAIIIMKKHALIFYITIYPFFQKKILKLVQQY